MKNLMITGFLMVSVAAMGNMTGNEQVSADLDYSLRVRQVMTLAVSESVIDFGLLTRGEAANISANSGATRVVGSLKGEQGSTINVAFSEIDNDNLLLTPNLTADGEHIMSGGEFVLRKSSDFDFGIATLGFGGDVMIKEDAASGSITETVKYLFSYK